AAEVFGEGSHDLEAVLQGDQGISFPTALSVRLVWELSVGLLEVVGGAVHRNDQVIVRGSGLLGPGEGEVLAHLEGEFVSIEGVRGPVVASRPVRPAERFSRDRGLVALTSHLGGVRPGSFDGTVRLESRALVGEAST